MTPQDRECPRRQRCAQAISNRVARLQRLQRPAGQGPVGVIRALRFAAKYVHVRANPLGAETRAAEQSAAAHGREYRVQVDDVFQQFLCRRGLSGDDAVIVVGMHQMRACLCLDTVAGCLPRSHRRLAENNFSAVALDGSGFHGGCILKHDDPRRNSSPGSRASHRGAMISARLRDDPLRRLFLCQGEDRVRRPANFERAGLLQVFVLEEELCPGHSVQGRRRQDRRTVDPGGDTRMRREDVLPTWWLVACRFDGGSGVHEPRFGSETLASSSRVPCCLPLLKRHYGMLTSTPYWYFLAMPRLILD